MAAARHCSSWADFQLELVGLVRRRVPSLADRVRLGAVCRSWRHNARLEPVPPPFPWLTLLDGTFLSIPDGEVHCVPDVPPGDSRCHGSVGNWLFLEHVDVSDGESSLSLTNLFSGDVVWLPDKDTIWRHEPVDNYPFERRPILYKPVLLSPSMDLSPDSLFTALITENTFQSVISVFQSSTAAVFRVSNRDMLMPL
ncbi:hypothetical protein BAE44_0015628 [Dichanthelium oligosanthes]|uniref:KIB1-4 beta-propeller domain-containing protein n=1 Tax=Dichanthelium oligosanthes TaxID=888268 RepID=A0A1E5VDX2_9POAL|nr:hypothetical protein BAE44_0015628 [Dichanthelium oligosanthes]